MPEIFHLFDEFNNVMLSVQAIKKLLAVKLFRYFGLAITIPFALLHDGLAIQCKNRSLSLFPKLIHHRSPGLNVPLHGNGSNSHTFNCDAQRD